MTMTMSTRNWVTRYTKSETKKRIITELGFCIHVPGVAKIYVNSAVGQPVFV